MAKKIQPKTDAKQRQENPTVDAIELSSMRSLRYAHVQIKDANFPYDLPSFLTTDHSHIEQIESWYDFVVKNTIDAIKTKDAKFTNRASFDKALSGIGNVNFKMPDSRADVSPIFINSELKSTINLVSPSSCKIESELTYSGDSACSPFAKLLLAKFCLDGKVESIFTIIRKYGAYEVEVNPFITALMTKIKVHIDGGTIEKITKIENQDQASIPIHATTKQIYFCEEGKDDILILPVSYDGYIAELHKRLKHLNADSENGWKNKVIPSSSKLRIVIGGTKPQNAGFVANEFANGGLPLLCSLPPSSNHQSSSEKIIYQLKNNQIPFDSKLLSRELVDKIIKDVPQEVVVRNRKARVSEMQAYASIAKIVANRIDAISFALEENKVESEMALKFRKICGLIDNASLTEAEKNEMTTDIANAIFWANAVLKERYMLAGRVHEAVKQNIKGVL